MSVPTTPEEGQGLQLVREVKVVLPFAIGNKAVNPIVVAKESAQLRIISKLPWLRGVGKDHGSSLKHVEDLEADPLSDHLIDLLVTPGFAKTVVFDVASKAAMIGWIEVPIGGKLDLSMDLLKVVLANMDLFVEAVNAKLSPLSEESHSLALASVDLIPEFSQGHAPSFLDKPFREHVSLLHELGMIAFKAKGVADIDPALIGGPVVGQGYKVIEEFWHLFSGHQEQNRTDRKACQIGWGFQRYRFQDIVLACWNIIGAEFRSVVGDLISGIVVMIHEQLVKEF